jgi:hypothetical protein
VKATILAAMLFPALSIRAIRDIRVISAAWKRLRAEA